MTDDLPSEAMIEVGGKALWEHDRYGYQNDGGYCAPTYAEHDTNGRANYNEMARRAYLAMQAARVTPMSDVERVAALLCDDHDARVLAGREFAPSFADSPDDVKAYWRRIAALSALRDGE